MSMAYIRSYYRVPAKRGGRVRLGIGFGGRYAGRIGVIASAPDQYLRVRLDDGERLILHPTWEVDYLEAPR